MISSKSNSLNEILSKLNTSNESTLQLSTSIDIATIIQSFIPFLVIATIMGKIGDLVAKKRKASDKIGANSNKYTG